MPEVKSKVGQLEIGGHKKGLNAPGCCTYWNSDDIAECVLFGEDFQVLLNVLCENILLKKLGFSNRESKFSHSIDVLHFMHIA